MKQHITAAFTSQIPDGGAPEEIVYFPEGVHQISATVDGKPGKLTVRIPAEKGPQIAAALQSALEKRRASNVRPWFDFEHKRGVASALPKAFRYEPGRGVMCALEWTGAGKSAVEGRDFSYFSPEFYLGDDGIPDGLPERGPLGALVNEPAFREIPRIAASDAVPDPEPNQPQAMSKLIFAALAIRSFPSVTWRRGKVSAPWRVFLRFHGHWFICGSRVWCMAMSGDTLGFLESSWNRDILSRMAEHQPDRPTRPVPRFGPERGLSDFWWDLSIRHTSARSASRIKG